MDVDAGATWSDIAGWYDELVRRGSGPHETAGRCLLDLVPAGALAGAAVVDVACGTGLATRALAEHGAARVVGVDSSSEMIELARGHGDAGGRIAYLVDDAQELGALRDRRFDGATCQLGLMDIPDLDRTLAAVHRVLRPGGWFTFVIGHPCFLVPDARPTTIDGDGAGGGERPAVTVTGYFHERFWRSTNPQGVRRAGNHHRRLSTYLNAAIAAGFTIAAVDEPQAGPLLAEQSPLYREVPIFLAARLVAATG